MGPEPAFSSNTAAAWPLAGSGALPPERDDPDFAFPRGALQLCPRDLPEKPFVSGTSSELAVPAEPLATRSPLSEHKRKWTAAIAVSCILHVAVAMAFFIAPDNEVLIEGADEAGIMLLGNAPQDQQSAGDVADSQPDATNVTLVTMLDPKPVATVESLAVTEVETLQPVEEMAAEAPAERLEPVQEAALQPDAIPERIEPTDQEPVQAAPADPLPEILSTDVQQPDADEVVVQKSAPVEAVAPETAEVETAEVEPTERVVAEPVPTPTVKPEPEPAPRKQVEAKKPAPKKAETPQPRKQVAKAAKPKAGSGGQNQADARRGAAGGEAEGTTAAASKGRSQSAAGNAAVSNYPGKVAVKLRRAVRGISRSARSKARQDVQIAFVVSAAGGVGGVRIVKSSGSPELDEAAVATVHRAAPFPPIPAEAGRANWAFTLPLGVR